MRRAFDTVDASLFTYARDKTRHSRVWRRIPGWTRDGNDFPGDDGKRHSEHNGIEQIEKQRFRE